MSSKSSPLVSIITPVYNNADDLPECIESILAQTYQNWDYTIVNNCSTDGSAEIARRYASRDPRIRVLDNTQFLRVIQNHNHALRQISPESKYCKMVFADDWIFPRCIEEMVAVGEEHPSVGLVGAYALWQDKSLTPEYIVMWVGLPYPARRVSGREVCRRSFLTGMNVFGTSTSHMYRSDLVRGRDPFFNEKNLHADWESCADILRTSDFGFVHQVLTFTRGRSESLSRAAVEKQMYFGCRLQTLITLGHEFLTPDEFDRCRDHLLGAYYNALAVSVMRRWRDKAFWDFHKGKLKETVGFSHARLAGAILARGCRMVLNPYETFEKLRPKSAHKPVRAGSESGRQPIPSGDPRC